MGKQQPVIELELYLIRHGESKGNVPRDSEVISVKEAFDPSLTEKGIAQAKLAGEHLKDVDFDVIYSSALQRTVHTASEIIKRQKKSHTLKILPLITEAGVSPEYITDFDFVHTVNSDAVLAPEYDKALPLLCYTDSKDEKGLFDRADEAVKYVREHHSNGEKVALVCHAAIMTYLCFICMGFREKVPAFDLDFKNTGITKIIFYKKGTNPYGDIVFYFINSTTHLGSPYGK